MLNNKIKVLILSLFLLFTGCTANYEVEIKDGKATESFSVINKDISSWKNDLGGLTYEELIDIYYEKPPKIYSYLIYGGDDPEEESTYDDQEEVKYKEQSIDPTYKSEKISSSTELGVKLSYTFDIDKYKDSSILDYYLTNLSVEHKENNILSIYATPEWNVFSRYENLENVNITIKTNYEILKTNADSNINGVLKWNIDKNSTRKGKTIVLELNLNEEKEYIPEYIAYIILILIILLITIVGYKIYFRVKVADKV